MVARDYVKPTEEEIRDGKFKRDDFMFRQIGMIACTVLVGNCYGYDTIIAVNQ